MRKLVAAATAIALTLALFLQPAWAGECLGKFPAMFRSLGAGQSAQVTKAYRRFGARGKNGMIAIVGHRTPAPDIDAVDIDHILDIFKVDVAIDANPFGTSEGLFEAIADLTDVLPDGGLQMKEGLADTIKQLGNRSAGDEYLALYQGAAHDLFVATRDIGNSRVVSFQERIPVPGGGVRIADVLEECPGSCPSGILGVFHENKNWTTELTGATDERLVHYAGQFRRDVLVQAATNWEYYRLNLRPAVQGQSDLIRDTLLLQFSDPALATILGPNGVSAARATFIEAWNSGRIASFH